MAFNEAVAGRVRKSLEGTTDFDEKRMFGGIAFMVRGNMCCGVYVEPAGFASPGDLKAWIGKAMAFALSLAAK